MNKDKLISEIIDSLKNYPEDWELGFYGQDRKINMDHTIIHKRFHLTIKCYNSYIWLNLFKQSCATNDITINNRSLTFWQKIYIKKYTNEILEKLKDDNYPQSMKDLPLR